jgi:2-methylisocitrate lyase-like PEP mutase family enzyme
MADQAQKAERFLALHQQEVPLLLANVWDVGSARLVATMGFQALATTSSGHAASLGKIDGSVTRDEALSHAATIVAATDLPVSADLEKAFADEPGGVAETIELALGTGLAGASVEDYSGDEDDPIYDLGLATERVAAAVEVAHRGPVHFVITARAENFLHGRPDLDDTIERLQAYERAGADVLFAPGLREADDIRRVVESVDRPVNVLGGPGRPPVADLGELGVSRISVGGSFAFNSYGALVEAATELRDAGTYGFFERAASTRRVIGEAFG